MKSACVVINFQDEFHGDLILEFSKFYHVSELNAKCVFCKILVYNLKCHELRMGVSCDVGRTLEKPKKN